MIAHCNEVFGVGVADTASTLLEISWIVAVFARGPVWLIIVLADARAVTGVRVRALIGTGRPAGRGRRFKAIIRAGARAVAGVGYEAGVAGVGADCPGGLVIGCTGPGAVAGVGVGALAVCSITAGSSGGVIVALAGSRTVAGIRRGAFIIRRVTTRCPGCGRRCLAAVGAFVAASSVALISRSRAVGGSTAHARSRRTGLACGAEGTVVARVALVVRSRITAVGGLVAGPQIALVVEARAIGGGAACAGTSRATFPCRAEGAVIAGRSIGYGSIIHTGSGSIAGVGLETLVAAISANCTSHLECAGCRTAVAVVCVSIVAGFCSRYVAIATGGRACPAGAIPTCTTAIIVRDIAETTDGVQSGHERIHEFLAEDGVVEYRQLSAHRLKRLQTLQAVEVSVVLHLQLTADFFKRG